MNNRTTAIDPTRERWFRAIEQINRAVSGADRRNEPVAVLLPRDIAERVGVLMVEAGR